MGTKLRTNLRFLPTQQDCETQEIWQAGTTRNSITTLGTDLYGFDYRSLQRQRLHQCWVIVDRFTKMAHFIPLKNRKARELALILVREVWGLHGLPKRVISDRDTVFMSSFWSGVMRLLEVELDKSSAYHPQTDSQTERVNQI